MQLISWARHIYRTYKVYSQVRWETDGGGEGGWHIEKNQNFVTWGLSTVSLSLSAMLCLSALLSFSEDTFQGNLKPR